MPAPAPQIKIVVLAGPTAVGKSAVAVELARALGAEIINADSMQVYRGMDIGTAKPTLEDRRGVPHHLIDIVEPDEEFSAGRFRDLAQAAIHAVDVRGHTALVVGGTGLYIKVLLGGLFACPPIPSAIRLRLREECDTLGPSQLHRRLQRLDPAAARKIHPQDRQRIIRALEVVTATQRPLSEWTRPHGFGQTAFKALKIALNCDRTALYERIDRRVHAMLAAGLLQEVERLLGHGFTASLKSMQSIGYRHMIRYLEGAWSLDEAVQQLQRDTRRYAKRQLTWFRADPEFLWLQPADSSIILRKITDFLTDPA